MDRKALERILSRIVTAICLAIIMVAALVFGACLFALYCKHIGAYGPH